MLRDSPATGAGSHLGVLFFEFLDARFQLSEPTDTLVREMTF